MSAALLATALTLAGCSAGTSPGRDGAATVPAGTIPSTTAVPAVVATVVPPPAPVPPAVERAAAPTIDDATWAALARCESGMTNLAGPLYFGFHSWLLSTWRAAGGTGRPDDHTYDEQVAIARSWQARTSWAQWPACSRRLGLA